MRDLLGELGLQVPPLTGAGSAWFTVFVADVVPAVDDLGTGYLTKVTRFARPPPARRDKNGALRANTAQGGVETLTPPAHS